MFKNHFKMAFRQLRINKIYSLINILGLSIGLAACFITLLYVAYQTSYDKYNEKLDDIYLVTTENKGLKWTEPSTPMILAQTLKDEIPEVKEVARWAGIRSSIKFKEDVVNSRGSFADPEIFDILTLHLKYGDINSIKKEKDFLVINETTSKRFFGEKNPIGEVLSVGVMNEAVDLKVTAVMYDVPKTTTFIAEFIAPHYFAEKYYGNIWKNLTNDISHSWDFGTVKTYILASPNANIQELGNKIDLLSKRHIDARRESTFQLFPVKDIYFHSSKMVNSRFPTGSISNVYIYSIAAFLLLFIACVNYLMLNLGRASLRTKEIGVRKVSGARKTDLFKQIITEAVVVTLISLPIAILLIEFMLPDISQLLGVKIESDYFHNFDYILGFLGVTLFVGVVTGSYIALYLSGFNPVDILKNKMNTGAGKVIFRRILITTQMVIFIGLIFSSVIINKQLQYFINKDFGFNKENLLVFKPEDGLQFGKTYAAFKNELIGNPGIINVTGAQGLPGQGGRGVDRIPKKDHPEQMVSVEGLSGDEDLIKTMGMKIVAGSDFQKGPSGESPECIINEAAVRELGLTNPIGEEIRGARVIGVVKDFNMHSLHEKIAPLMMRVSTKYMDEIAVRVKPDAVAAVIDFVKEKSKQFNNGRPMSMNYFDDRLDAQYAQEHKFSTVIQYATAIAVFVACLGLFGISLFICQQRLKEIGIRKTLGATVKDVYLMVTREFVYLILVSSLIAFPIGYYLISKWLQNFEYRIDIDASAFILSALIGIVIVVGTVSYQAIKASLTNPVNSLRSE